MSKINDGGPVHPAWELNDQGGLEMTGTGLSLRDYFAGLAMQGSRARPSQYKSWEDLTNDAYEIADAMLAARAKGGADGQ